MNHGHTPAGDRWRMGLCRADGTLAERVVDIETERGFWARRMAHPPEPDAYAVAVYQVVERLARQSEVQSVLEVGSGWGNYTLPLCRDFPLVTAVELSPENLRYVTDMAAGEGRKIRAVCGAWEEVALQNVGGACGHDMAFGYNCFYRLTEPEDFLKKLDSCAKKLCVIGMNCPPELPWLPALERAGMPVHYMRLGCRELEEVLVSMGISPVLLDIPNRREYRYPSADALLARARQFLTAPVEDRALLDVLAPFHRQQPDGSLVCSYPFTSQLLAWQPGKTGEPALSNEEPGCMRRN